MSFRIIITTPPLDWSPRKREMMRQDIVMMLAQQGAPNCQWREEDLSNPDSLVESEPEKLYLHLFCKDCEIEWYAERFEPCGQCASRSSVHKKQFKRVPLPAPGVLTEQ